jgi:hypothetical protein
MALPPLHIPVPLQSPHSQAIDKITQEKRFAFRLTFPFLRQTFDRANPPTRKTEENRIRNPLSPTLLPVTTPIEAATYVAVGGWSAHRSSWFKLSNTHQGRCLIVDAASSITYHIMVSWSVSHYFLEIFSVRKVLTFRFGGGSYGSF